MDFNEIARFEVPPLALLEFEGVEMRQLGIIFLVGLPPPVILDPFPRHTQPQHKNEGDDGAGGVEGGDEGDGLEDGGHEEVDVGVAFELQEEGEGDEGEEVVLGGGDVVGFGLGQFGAGKGHLEGVVHSFIINKYGCRNLLVNTLCKR